MYEGVYTDPTGILFMCFVYNFMDQNSKHILAYNNL